MTTSGSICPLRGTAITTSVVAGSTVRFVIHNVDPIDHEFIIGPPETHDIHERGEPHFHTGAVRGEVTVPAGATVETTWTFGQAGSPDVAYGCHLAGHWDYGMHGKALIRSGTPPIPSNTILSRRGTRPR